MRAKTEYVMETNASGKTMPKKIGLAPVQRDGLEYEFDICGDMDLENNLIISKSRCPGLTGQVIHQPGKEFAALVNQWLTTGVPALPKIDREALVAQTQDLLLRRGWSVQDGKEHLKVTYNKSSRQMLTDQELIDFLHYLQHQLDILTVA